jgi:hypothetical protein
MLATASTVMATNMPPKRNSREFCSLFDVTTAHLFLQAIGFIPSVIHPICAIADKRVYLFFATGFPPDRRGKKTV